MELRYSITVSLYEDEFEKYWVAKTVEFPGVSGIGDTSEEAMADLKTGLYEMITYMRELGQPIPDPIPHSAAMLPRRSLRQRSAHRSLASRPSHVGR